MNEDMLPENIEICLYSPNKQIRVDMIHQIGSNLDKRYIDVAVKDPEWQVRRAVVDVCNLTEQQVDFLLDDPDPYVRIGLPSHFTTVKQHNKGLTDKSLAVCREVMFFSPFTNQDTIVDILTNCEHSSLRRDILDHKLLNSSHIALALKDREPLVRLDALYKDHLLTKKQLKYVANNDPDYLVRTHVVYKLKTLKWYINKRYSDN